ncbi:MCE family protein [Aeromonas salmonicida subsp. achromogenes]|uniref:MlaD family protein n=1 Tax=Aeromonas salmonicida TaxID=645 RepID=UPI00030D8AAB|nr:MlaD family protein [Aeromonas salmonicida]TMX09550.1 MCE family protein [Aeromonas salmonicida subsp. achromogenes]TMX11483.1 MCE family protein [Aeromonas salmonicida subsp. achromogenes]TMX17482.1 MCE family protein [Aeromonas salmonicida subsp. achromogenes]TMX20119.1 MCE family protein [Aeromonas salmonicida subsp. achromogenes]
MIGAEPVIEKRRWLSPVWLLPFIALLLAVGFIYQQFASSGQLIRINFAQGNGILPGKTQLRYQGVAIGVVQDLELAEDGHKIAVLAKIDSRARSLIRKGSDFWLVSPKASLTEISGLDTLVSGNYINLQPGRNNNPLEEEFDALDGPPPGYQAQGRMLHLTADSLGSVGIGARLYFRGIEVGSVINTRLGQDNQNVILDLVIEPRFEHLVKADTRFWNISGIKGSFSLAGVSVEAGSLTSILSGGIAFDSPKASPEPQKGQTFTLYKGLAEAARGERIDIAAGDLPIKEGMPILYEGIEIGRIDPIRLTNKGRIVTALINPEQAFRITGESRLVWETVSLGASGLKHADRLLAGPAIRLDYVAGERVKAITLSGQDQVSGTRLTLLADDLAGLNEGAPLWYKGLQIGQINQLSLDANGNASVALVVNTEYQHLLKRARFYRASPLQIDADLSGIKVETSPASAWIGGGIKLVQAVTGERINRLYPSQELALLGTRDAKPQRWLLKAEQADGIGIGSPVLYLGLEAGKVKQLRAAKEGVEIELEIDGVYAPLLSRQPQFWKKPALDTRVRGVIEFDRLGTGRSSHQLFDSKEQARAKVRALSLVADNNPGLGVGSPLRYRGVDIGKIEQIELEPSLGQVIFKAELDGQYAERFMQSGACFTLVQAKLGLGGIAHLDTLIKGAFVEAQPGQGAGKDRFPLSQTGPVGLALTLKSPSVSGLSVVSPLLFRKLVVGSVTGVALARDGSEVLIDVSVDQEYAHLVRANTRFWNVSGVKADIGLTGGTIEVETVQSLLAGGIAFNTPEREMGPTVKAGHRYPLHGKAEKEWLEWSPRILP